MKRLILLTTACFFMLTSWSAPLILIETGSPEKVKELFSVPTLTIHYYTDAFAIATGEYDRQHVILDENAFADPSTLYYLLWLDQESRTGYLETVSAHASLLYTREDFTIVSVDAPQAIHLFPAIHGGMVRISDREAQLPAASFPARSVMTVRADIEAMLAQVSQDSLQAIVQHLEDYGTRNAYTPQSVDAQNWIYDRFASYGLDVELHDFTMPGGSASDNVIATLTGTVYPEEIVVLGAHYDSYSFSALEPGADDNATGTAGILEAARIMSQYTFDRTIIFATWSGEEYGLYGSEAWATEAAASGMNILGYFNMDMAGYLHPGDEIHTDIIAPSSANELRQFYKDVCAIYLPDFEVYDGALSGGDSDHTSFNQNGFMGIFPFEDSQNYSPYIHTSNDIIGPSVNSFEMHGTFTKAIIANVATMADQLPVPENLYGIAGDGEVTLHWTALEDVDYYNIYRDVLTAPYDTCESTEFLDVNVTNGVAYTYNVTAIFEGSGEESDPSNAVTVVPMPPISLPFFDDYETGGPYWTFEQGWGLNDGTYHSSTHSMTESPEGNYPPNMNASATLRAVDFTGASTAQISFWTRYRIESGYDFMYLEVSVNGTDWDQLDSFSGNQLNWGQKTFSLNNYVSESNVQVRFRFFSDVYVEDQGMYIDDLEIMINGVGIEVPAIPGNEFHLTLQPNPADQSAIVGFHLSGRSWVKAYLTGANGQMVKEIVDQNYDAGSHTIVLNVTDLPAGNYILTLEANGQRTGRKLVVNR